MKTTFVVAFLTVSSLAFSASASNRLLNSAAPFKHIWPVCLYGEAGTADFQQVAKILNEQMAKCRVKLIMEPVIVKDVPSDPTDLTTQVSSRCRAIGALKRLNVDRASAIFIGGASAAAAAQALCERPGAKDIVSCGQFAKDPGKQMVSTVKQIGAGGSIAKKGEPAVAFVAAGMAGTSNAAEIAQKAAAEAFGRGLALLPPGDGAGMGVGLAYEGYAGARSGERKGSEQLSEWTEDGCAVMRSNAIPYAPGIPYNPAEEFKINDQTPVALAEAAPFGKDPLQATGAGGKAGGLGGAASGGAGGAAGGQGTSSEGSVRRGLTGAGAEIDGKHQLLPQGRSPQGTRDSSVSGKGLGAGAKSGLGAAANAAATGSKKTLAPIAPTANPGAAGSMGRAIDSQDPSRNGSSGGNAGGVNIIRAKESPSSLDPNYLNYKTPSAAVDDGKRKPGSWRAGEEKK